MEVPSGAAQESLGEMSLSRKAIQMKIYAKATLLTSGKAPSLAIVVRKKQKKMFKKRY